MAAKLPIFISSHFDFGENLKNHFPKNVFNEIWLTIGDYEYIYNTEIKIEKFYSCAALGAKQFFADPPSQKKCLFILIS